MPYIKQRHRKRAETQPLTSGELNYAITKLLHGYLVRKGLNYQHINDCLGALSGAAQEFYRRIAAPYEDTKITENGDVTADG